MTRRLAAGSFLFVMQDLVEETWLKLKSNSVDKVSAPLNLHLRVFDVHVCSRISLG